MQTPWRPCGTGADDATVGTTAWTNPTRITAGDGSYATASSIGAAQSHYIEATNFGFTDADFGGATGQTIQGIEFRWTRHSNAAGSTDASIKAVKAGTISGTDQSAGATWANPSVDELKIFGSGSNLWGLTWNQSDISGVATFGCVMSANSGGAATLSVDFCECRITFAPATIIVRRPMNSRTGARSPV